MDLFIPGFPAPAGSKTAIPLYTRSGAPLLKNGRVIVNVKDSCKRTKSWQAHVSSMVADAWKSPPLDCAVEVWISFTMPRPKSHYYTGKRANVLRDDAPQWHTGKPDVLKLARAVEDAITGIVLVDDSCIAWERISKFYGDKSGVQITLKAL